MKKWDYFLIVVYMLSAGAIFFFSMGMRQLSHNDYDGKYVQIQVAGEIIKEIDLPVESRQTIPIQTQNGYNTIVVEGSNVSIQESNCRDQICVHQGTVNKVGAMLVCLPNKVIVEIMGQKEEDIDVMSF